MKRTARLREIMTGFAERTGLAKGAASPRRYLWTDAFAACNFLELFRRTGEQQHLDRAIQLVDQVHHVLGRHREDDPRNGWISGLAEQDGEEHPTLGGLRIGKEINERAPGEPLDERLEWDRDGQYFHYLTKWMHALARVAQVSGEARYHRWAVELAKAAHAGFSYAPLAGGPKRLYWKMSIDFSHPLVPSMGHHDPLDGLITFLQLQAGRKEIGGAPADLDLDTEISEMAEMCDGGSWETMDALGIGGLLTDACRLAQLIALSGLPESERLEQLLGDAEASLALWSQTGSLDVPATYRLAFRELGMSIGLHAIEKIQEILECNRFPNQDSLQTRLSRLARFRPIIETIEEFWLQPRNQQSAGWNEHRDINSVMLATSLGPEAFLMLN